MSWRETPLSGWAALSINSLAVLYGIAFLVWAPNGLGLLLASQSLLISAAVWLLLHRHCTTGDTRSAWWAAFIVVTFMLWAFIGGFSLSFGTFPAACLLVVAAVLTPAGVTQAKPS